MGGMDWIDPAQDRDWWRALVNAVMNLQVLGPTPNQWLPKANWLVGEGDWTLDFFKHHGAVLKRKPYLYVTYIRFCTVNNSPQNHCMCLIRYAMTSSLGLLRARFAVKKDTACRSLIPKLCLISPRLSG